MSDHVKELEAFVVATRGALRMARIEQPEAESLAAVGYVLPSGAGKITARFNGETFCDALYPLRDTQVGSWA